MYITFKKEDVIDGLSRAIGIIPLKSGSSYLRSIWIETKEPLSMRIMATDSTTEFIGTYNAVINKSGSVGVNAKAFVDLIRKLPSGDITLKLDEATRILHIEQGRRSYKLPTADPTWFNPLSEFPEENSILWSGDFFQEIIDKTYFCISEDESAEQLSCFYMKNVNDAIDCCGLNGHQLAVATFKNDDLSALLPEKGLLLQKKYTAELRKWLDLKEISLNISERRLYLRNAEGSETLSFARADYNYPNHLSFLQRLTTGSLSYLELSRKELLDALDRILIFNNENDRCTYFDLKSSELMLSAQGQDTGSAQEHLEVKYSGSLTKVAFPTKNLMEILTHYNSETVMFTLTGIETPCGITGSTDPDYTVIIMPMKIASSSIYDEEDDNEDN